MQNNKKSAEQVPQMQVEELKKLLEARAEVTLLDVREDDERSISHIGGIHIPLAQIPERRKEIPTGRPVVVYCRGGARSQKVAEFLVQEGYSPVSNLAGGILAWAKRIDSTLKT